jgi:hypothetical protein
MPGVVDPNTVVQARRDEPTVRSTPSMEECEMRIWILRLPVAAVILLFALAGCFAGMTGDVDQVLAQTDRSDPLRAAVADVLAAADQNFEPVLGPPLSASERSRLVDEWTSFRWSTQGQSSMDLLRMAESMAASARSVRVGFPGADPIYYEQTIVTGNVNALSRRIEFRVPGPFEERQAVAADLVRRLEPMFTGASNWNRIDLYDPAQNPVIGTTSFSSMLSMGMDASSTLVMVSVDYYHDRGNHEAMRGVRVAIMLQATGVE